MQSPEQLQAFRVVAGCSGKDALKHLTAALRALFSPPPAAASLSELLSSVAASIPHRRFESASLYAMQLGLALSLSAADLAFDQLLGMEKALVPAIAERCALQQLALLAEQPFPQSQRFPEACDLLRLLLCVCSIAPDLASQPKARQQLMVALRRALVSRPHHARASLDWIRRAGLEDLQLIWHGRCDFSSVKEISQRVDDVLEDTFSRIAQLTQSRSSFSNPAFHALTDETHPGIFVPFCVKLFRNIFDPSEPDLSDLSEVTDDSIGSRSLNILKSGFSRWGFGQSFVPKSRRPTENRAIMLFITGGITFSEVQKLNQLHKSSHFADTPFYIASTHISKPSLSILFENIY